jgi:uncharacterized membrane protein YccF (DUF307 family)
MKILGNIVWLLFGGLLIALEYLVSSIILCITIVGIPFGIQTMKLAGLALLPFGKEIRQKKNTGGCLFTMMNLIWLLCGGIWICLSHLVFGAFLCITVIGIPFGIQHFKLAALAISPFGSEVINS